MSRIPLEKIEELTLYIIELKEENKAIKKQLESKNRLIPTILKQGIENQDLESNLVNRQSFYRILSKYPLTPEIQYT